MIFGGQQSAVQPAGFGGRKKPRYVQMMEAQRGMATAGVVAGKQRQQQEEEKGFARQTEAFNRAQAEKSLATQQQQADIAEESAETQKKLGYASTGVNLLNTILSFF